MRHSIYIHLATLFVKADIKRENNAWKRKVRRSQYHLPWHSEHLLRDIGLGMDGRPFGEAQAGAPKAERRIRLLRRILTARQST
ncbi:DUF1127 domain-containing protein [Vibrio sp. S17_S38]|uniref:DUF1127 domain-containing protein n=1 Tax=Vibrio sp. S17_S38 TaxID=2720229 RepID=UPI0016802386|nr:DUF1127 domain-containing protein [Vibrio sp. S17_S38]MBD1572808.1 DUF1127 domain-containing protein [Vibrio sp. S17_S38]